ncbi:protein of unknown function [Xenorhabdus doucetiae]|uniref:Transposase n=1 Tax=Xenorhabdus doucetiae TaxID=351671 RepID=A0A068QR18_9GAMM|nr:protein of unknown function [Xenorhabdus doucetiae]
MGRLHKSLHFGPAGILQTLGMFLLPAKAPAQKQLLMTDGNVLCAHLITWQAAQVSAIAYHLNALPRAYYRQYGKTAGHHRAD